MKHVKFIIPLLLVFILVIAGCSNSTSQPQDKTKQSDPSDSKKLHIVTTFYPMYEFTKNIVKEQAQVDLLIPSTIEPHDWDPSPKDVANIQKADLFVYNSPSMETWVPSVENSMGDKHPQMVVASEGIDLMEGEAHHHGDHEHGDDHAHEADHEHDHDHGTLDPHVWLSPVLAQKEVENITKAIIDKDPKNEDVYKKNSEKYIEQLKKLDQQYRTTLKDVPRKELITQHAAFGYLAKEYGLEQVPIAGLSPEQEPSAAKLSELKKFAKEHNVNVIFFEELASPKVAETLANEIGAKTEILHTLEGLSKEDQEKGLDYITVMEDNLNILREALQ
ncbi:metal ABC transporter substrate-binding protein [Lederbergia sp. NSJ-179]|uniref:metal ABC transporter substrate-binding protein n=1 Tax=Lederbergia sp. NSJ-179 TaxID=2931402 RepID=UPI001FD08541|nr:metal ABC transporter substrate-binding protein [Lederbergia sp. NSJ-179]MCJ7841629.1 metal ABC transporter substrate-binding protein [Lederbergia sp. NSJ-179]